MNFSKTYTESHLGLYSENHKKVVVVYKGPPCSPKSRPDIYNMFRMFLETQGAIDCGLTSFDRLNMLHDGTCWVVTLEAENT